jgi:hypothetical protein
MSVNARNTNKNHPKLLSDFLANWDQGGVNTLSKSRIKLIRGNREAKPLQAAEKYGFNDYVERAPDWENTFFGSVELDS